ncbi:hypothetical protein K3495_g7138 [Podosphaera aphanis]|nr:hypothetical protein K3495_g7138 [Podosphaera aphanis]
MRGIQIKEYVQSPTGLRVDDLPDPPTPEAQYLIEIRASATNYFDLLQIAGKYQHQPLIPWIAGSEFSGVVLSVPNNMPANRKPKFQIGDRVFGASQGAFATKIAAKEESLKPIPESWSFLESAGLSVTAPTSYAALVTRAGIKPGDHVLIHGAAGGVGLAAVQIAKAMGATVIATGGTQYKLDVAKVFGADHLINHTDSTWPNQVKKLTPEGRGVDIVFDPVGMIDISTKCSRSNACLLVIGFAAGSIEKLALNKVLLKNISIVGLHWGAYTTDEPEITDRVWQGIFELIRTGKFRPTVYTDKTFIGLRSVPEALQVLEARRSWGKVVVAIPREERSNL